MGSSPIDRAGIFHLEDSKPGQEEGWRRMSCLCSAVWDSDRAKDESRKAASGLEPQGKMETLLGEFQVGWEERIQDGS